MGKGSQGLIFALVIAIMVQDPTKGLNHEIS